MKAICVNDERQLEVRDLPAPEVPPPGHVLVDIEACGINHGDKVFLSSPGAAGGLPGASERVWGASAAGTVRAIGAGVPGHARGAKVAMYRSLSDSPETLGLWCERAQVLYSSCVILPDGVSARDYCASLVNVVTAYAFLCEIAGEGHHGILATAGASATALALSVVARSKQVPVIHLVCTAAERGQLHDLGIGHVLVTGADDFETELGELAESLQATAVFDGLGGALVGRMAPHLPMGTTIRVYGLLDAGAPISLPARVLMSRDLVIRRFSNFNSATVRDPLRRMAALAALGEVIDDPLLRTKVGQVFPFDAIGDAMAYAGGHGHRAVLVPPVAAG